MKRYTVPTRHLVPFLFVALFITQLGLSLGDLPGLELMQDILCKRHYGLTTDGLLSEDECRDPAVQRALNRLNIGVSISATIGSALVSFPLGMLADRIGRVPILTASVLGLFLAQAYSMLVCWKWKVIPIEALWAVGGLLLVGGGQRMAEAMVFAMVSDVATEKQRAPWFQWVVGAVLAAELTGPFVAVRLVDMSLWLPLCISLALVFVGGCLLALFSPETLSLEKSRIDERGDCAGGTTKATVVSIFSRPALFLLPGAVLSFPMAATQSDILVRFMPVQFLWDLPRSALLVSLRGVTTVLTLLILLPGAAHVCNRRTDWSQYYRDGIFARASALCLLIGSVLLAMVFDERIVIAGVVASALGSGVPTLCRSMLVSTLRGKNLGMLFGVLAIGEVAGFLCCTVAMGALFDVALTSWIGYPFVLITILAAGIFAASWMAGTSSKETASTEQTVANSEAHGKMDNS